MTSPLDTYLKSIADRPCHDQAIAQIKLLRSAVDLWVEAIAAGDGHPREAIAHVRDQINAIEADIDGLCGGA